MQVFMAKLTNTQCAGQGDQDPFEDFDQLLFHTNTANVGKVDIPKYYL